MHATVYCCVDLTILDLKNYIIIYLQRYQYEEDAGKTYWKHCWY